MNLLKCDAAVEVPKLGSVIAGLNLGSVVKSEVKGSHVNGMGFLKFWTLFFRSNVLVFGGVLLWELRCKNALLPSSLRGAAVCFNCL